jgi:hypothetical protein
MRIPNFIKIRTVAELKYADRQIRPALHVFISSASCEEGKTVITEALILRVNKISKHSGKAIPVTGHGGP